MTEPSSVPAAASVGQLERRIHWRAFSLFAFLGILAGLAVVALVPVIAPPGVLTGLPDDADVTAATALMRGRVTFDAGPLRFESALLGDLSTGHPYTLDDEPVVARAAALLRRAELKRRGDARIVAALASLDFLSGFVVRAEDRYRDALDRAGHYGEARVGLGVVLARRAETERDPDTRRSLLLQSIAQFAAVSSRDPAHAAALYDRAVLLTFVGRSAEARTLAREYLAKDPNSRWAAMLRRATELPS